MVQKSRKMAATLNPAGTPRPITTISAPGLRPLHPRPSPAVMAMNAAQHPHPLAPHGNFSQSGQGPMAVGQAGVSGGLKRMAPRTQAAATEDYEEYNDVAMMGGVNLNEESRNILPNVIGPAVTGGRTCKEQLIVPPSALRARALKHTPGVNSLSDEATALLANALEERLKNLFARLSIAIENRTTQYRDCQLFEQETDVKGQLKFLEEIDRAEKVRHDDEERAALIKAARSRSRNENTDHLKMKEKARLLMQKEYELEKQREANITALAAIGSRKKRKLDTDFAQLSNDNSRNPGGGGLGPGGVGGVGGKFEGIASKRVIRRATMKDLVYVMEHDPILQRSQLIWKAIFK